MSLKARLKALEKRLATAAQDKPIRVLSFRRVWVTETSPLRGRVQPNGIDCYDVHWSGYPYMKTSTQEPEPDEYDALVSAFVSELPQSHKYVVIKALKPVSPETIITTNM